MTSSPPRVALWAVLLLAFVAGERRAIGKPVGEARQLVADAAVEYDLGHYDEAVRKYEACYRLIGDPVLLFDIGQAHRMDGKPELALRAYRSFLRTAPLDAPAREVAERHVATLERETAAVEGATPPAWRLAATPDVSREAAPSSRFYKKWWFWTAAAALVGGAALGFTLSDRREGPLAGSIEPGVVTVR
jgi:tetratricopeptide (TPR) repeat protein